MTSLEALPEAAEAQKQTSPILLAIFNLEVLQCVTAICAVRTWLRLLAFPLVSLLSGWVNDCINTV